MGYNTFVLSNLIKTEKIKTVLSEEFGYKCNYDVCAKTLMESYKLKVNAKLKSGALYGSAIRGENK